MQTLMKHLTPPPKNISVFRNSTTLPPSKAPHVMSPPECKCAEGICTGAVRGFFVAATDCRMVELGHAGRWHTLDRGADARPICPTASCSRLDGGP
eukprot:5564449-Alexandrium_andersonii.AAC.1